MQEVWFDLKVLTVNPPINPKNKKIKLKQSFYILFMLISTTQICHKMIDGWNSNIKWMFKSNQIRFFGEMNLITILKMRLQLC